jgi:predicted nucleic acid-binding protein
MLLPDINVWLALTFDSHVHHPSAKMWFDGFPNDAVLETHWRNFTQHQSFSPQVWNDAYLAAFALAGNLEMITFDKAFQQYANVTCTVLA